MAVGKLEKRKSISGSVTAASGSNVNEWTIRQYGNVVFVKFYVNKSSGTYPAGTETLVATLTGVDRPVQAIRLLCGCGAAAYAANESCYAFIGTDGTIRINPSVASAVVTFCFTYIVD